VRYRKPRSYRQRRIAQARQPVRQPIVRQGRPRGISRLKFWLALKPGRVKYTQAGTAQRESVNRAAKADSKLTRFDYRVLTAVHALTTAYSKCSDRIAIKQLAGIVFQVDLDDVTRKQRRKVGDSLRRLAKEGVIEYEPGRGRDAIATIGFSTPPEKGTPHAGVRSRKEKDPSYELKGPHLEAQKDPTRRTPTEKSPRSISEHGDFSEHDSERDRSGGTFTPERGKSSRSERE
jgi:hypothetical protein